MTAQAELDALLQEAAALRRQGQTESALPLYRRALVLAPGHARILYLIGATLQELGQGAKAQAQFQAVLDAEPNNVEALFQVGMGHYAAGGFEVASTYFQRMTAAAPQDPRAWVNLAASALQLGALDRGFQAASKALQIAPNHPDAWNNVGIVRHRRGEFAEAANAFRRALQSNPRHADIWQNLGDALRSANRLGEAESAYAEALRIAPGHVKAWINYGNLLGQLSREGEARTAFERALALDPAAREPLFNLAAAQVANGEEQAVIDRLGDLVDAGLADAEVLGLYAYALRAAGRVDEAERILLREGAGHPLGRAALNALGQLALARHSLLPQAVAACRDWLQNEAPTAALSERTGMQILLAQLLDKAGQPAEAFAAATTGKTLKGERSDPGAEQALAAALERAFTAARLRRPPCGLLDERRPVFIVGMPRSGTSLLEQMLAGHPDVQAAGEVDELQRIAGELAGGAPARWPERAVALDPYSLEALARRHLHRIISDAGDAPRITDKMPHNFVSIGLIHLLYPEARVVHIERDPRDLALSLYLHDFTGRHPYANDIEDIARHILFHRRCMAHWRAVLPPGVLHELRYEDLVADPEAHARRLLDFLALPWHPDVLRPEAMRRSVLTASRFQVQEPIHRRAAGRWRPYARQLQPLIRILREGGALPE